MSKKIYVDAAGNKVEIVSIEDHQVRFFPQGGGFERSMPRAEFDATFKTIDPAALEYRRIEVTIEAFEDGSSLKAYSNGMLWNGWVMPYFTREAAMAITRHVKEVTYDGERDVFVEADGYPEDGPLITAATTIRVGNEDVEVFAIGSGSWCWELADTSTQPQPPICK
ncbi:TPA: DUF4222 domain-containing protein [Burkholderia lata]